MHRFREKTFIPSILHCLIIALGMLSALRVAADDLLKINNGVAEVGIDRQKGGAITWLTWKGYSNNAVNIADPGRLIQQSYYAGQMVDRTSQGQSKAWSPWSWNPIQGGGVGSWARITKSTLKENRIYCETVPKLWDMPDEEAQARMRQWTAFEPGMSNVIVVKNEIICSRDADDPWGPAVVNHQEVPACYFTRNFQFVKSYIGRGEWRTEHQPPGPPWGRANPPLNVMACFEKGGQGIAVYSPAATLPWNFGPHGVQRTTKPSDGPCMHLAPIDQAAIGPRSTYRYRYWLIVGDATAIEERLETLIMRHSDESSELLDSANRSFR
ncbi:MAG: hypothetical protein R3C05_13310 [Pirellulaceae bacterium]